MRKRLVIGVVVFLAVIVLAFVFANGLINIDPGITGSAVAPIDVQYMPDGNLAYTYVDNLVVDEVDLPEESVDARQALLLSALLMRQEGKDMKNYNLLPSSRKQNKEEPIEKFNAYYSPSNNHWLVSFIGRFVPYEVCDVRLEIDGTLKSFECEESQVGA